jgi:ADP-ribose pyrophosphatase
MDQPPAIVEKRLTGCSNAVMEIFLDTVRLHNGDRVENFVVVAPRQRTKDNETGVAILPVDQGRMGLIRIYRHPLRAWCWEIPRGFIDDGETPREAAHRELAEETALYCEPGALMDLGTVAPEPGILAARTRVFAALSTESAEFAQEAEFGLREFRWFTPGELDALIGSGELLDCTSLIARARYLELSRVR